MDATQLLRYKTVLFVFAFLVLAAPGLAQTLQVSTNAVCIPAPGGVGGVDVVVSSTGAPITFSISTPAAWYRVDNITGPNTTTATLRISPFQSLGTAPPPSTLTISETTNAANFRNITVTYTPGGCTGGGGGTGLISASQTTVQFTTSPVNLSQNVTLTTTSTVPVIFSVTPGGAPLFVQHSVFPSTQVSLNNPATLAISANSAVVAGLANGCYTNTLTIAPTQAGATSTIVTVNLQVGTTGCGTATSFTVSPNSFNFAYPTGTQFGFSTLTSTATTTYNASATSSNFWLRINATDLFVQGVAVSSGMSISLDQTAAAQLPAGTYQGTVTITNPSNPSDSTNIGVTLAVSGGILPNLTLSPTSLTFNAAAGSTTPLSQSITMSTSAGATTYSISSITSSGWLSVTNAGTGTLTSAITVQANPTGLAQGTYQGSVNVTFTGGVNGTQSIPVTLVIGSGGGGTGLPAPSSLTFSAQAGSSGLVPPQSITVPGTGAISVTSSVSGTVQWLFASGSGNAPGVVVVNVSAGALAAGSYSGTVTITSGFGSTSIPVTLNVTTGAVVLPNPASINLSTSSLVQISVNSSDNSNIAFTATSSATWVTVTTAAGTTPGLVSVNVNTAGLPGGINTANIVLTATGAANSPVTIPVVALVEGSSITVSPASLTFSYNGVTAPAAQALSITSATAGIPFTIAATTSTGGNWLSAAASSGTTNTSVNISVNVAGLAAGQYTGTITVTPTGGIAVSVPVTLNVTAAVISATPTSLTFDYRIGDPAPAAKTVNVAGSGSFSATPQSTGNWLAVSPTSGTAPATLNVTITNLTSLTVGSVTGTIVVAGTGGATGSTTVTVTLNVTAPLPTIDRVTSAASFLTGPISPGEIITIFGTGIGPTPATGLSLDSSGRVSTTSGGVQVLVNGIASPMVFASATQVSAVVPYEVKGFLQATVQIRYLGQGSNVITQQVAATAPGLFTANSTGSGPVAFLPIGTMPTRGDVITIFGTGEGETSPAGVTGRVTTVSPTPPITPAPLLPVGVTIDGMPAEVLFVGEAPSLVSGVVQLNVRIPAGAASGDRPIQVTIGGVSSQTGVTVNIR